MRIRSALLVLLLALLAGCGVNPVTGKQELQFVSEESELQIGAQHYAPSRQSQGGDLTAFPEVSKYVAEVGGRLAAVSDRPLPYEFVVLNSSVPNAWALPGGKIAVNRGLLTALDNEAELAAVLGHEIVHAAARHGAKAQERGVLLQAGVLAAQVGVMLGDSDPNVGNLLVLGAGAGGTLGADRYTAALAALRAAKPAYDKADEAVAAATRKEFARAQSLASEAARLLPREGRFQQILGDIALAQQQHKAALGHYDKALTLDPNYFGGHLGAGLAAFRLGSPDRARQSLARSTELLPTAPALYHLGLLAQRAGNGAEAMRYFSAAAESNSDFGRRATFEVLREDLPRNPSRYLAAAAQRDPRGALVIVVQNRTSVPLADVQVTPELIGAGGAVEQRGAALRIGRPLAAGERVAIDAGVGTVSDDALARTRVRIDFARAVEP